MDSRLNQDGHANDDTSQRGARSSPGLPQQRRFDGELVISIKYYQIC